MKIVKTTEYHLLEEIHEKTFPDDKIPDFKNSISWVSYDKNTTVIAFITIAINQKLKYIDITRVGVVKDFCCKGIYTTLLETIEKYCKENKIDLILTYAEKENYPSLVALIKNNYIIYNPRHSYLKKDIFYHLMKRLR